MGSLPIINTLPYLHVSPTRLLVVSPLTVIAMKCGAVTCRSAIDSTSFALCFFVSRIWHVRFTCTVVIGSSRECAACCALLRFERAECRVASVITAHLITPFMYSQHEL
jgi:hypothetical protein